MLSTNLKPGRKSRTTWAPWKNGCTHLFALALGYFLFGVTAAATAYSVHTVLPGWLHTGGCRRKGVPILHQRGVSFNRRRRCPYSPGVKAVGPASPLSLAPSLV